MKAEHKELIKELSALLKENNLGSISSILILQSGQENFVEKSLVQKIIL